MKLVFSLSFIKKHKTIQTIACSFTCYTMLTQYKPMNKHYELYNLTKYNALFTSAHENYNMKQKYFFNQAKLNI